MASKTTQPQAHLAVRVCDDPVITIFLSVVRRCPQLSMAQKSYSQENQRRSTAAFRLQTLKLRAFSLLQVTSDWQESSSHCSLCLLRLRISPLCRRRRLLLARTGGSLRRSDMSAIEVQTDGRRMWSAGPFVTQTSPPEETCWVLVHWHGRPRLTALLQGRSNPRRPQRTLGRLFERQEGSCNHRGRKIRSCYYQRKTGNLQERPVSDFRARGRGYSIYTCIRRRRARWLRSHPCGRRSVGCRPPPKAQRPCGRNSPCPISPVR
jgi:hypothetical protein